MESMNKRDNYQEDTSAEMRFNNLYLELQRLPQGEVEASEKARLHAALVDIAMKEFSSEKQQKALEAAHHVLQVSKMSQEDLDKKYQV